MSEEVDTLLGRTEEVASAVMRLMIALGWRRGSQGLQMGEEVDKGCRWLRLMGFHVGEEFYQGFQVIRLTKA